MILWVIFLYSRSAAYKFVDKKNLSADLHGSTAIASMLHIHSNCFICRLTDSTVDRNTFYFMNVYLGLRVKLCRIIAATRIVFDLI
jgi:hypothetical protein